jgi:CheY-like chemotaxis protein
MLASSIVRPGLKRSSLHDLRGTTTILLVDDDPIVLALLKAILRREKYTVVGAEGSLEAIEIARHIAFDVLVTDFQMPGMNGFQLAKHLTAHRPALPVIFISGSAPDELPIREIRQRHWKFLPKPIDRGLLLRTIDYQSVGWAVRMRA